MKKRLNKIFAAILVLVLMVSTFAPGAFAAEEADYTVRVGEKVDISGRIGRESNSSNHSWSVDDDDIASIRKSRNGKSATVTGKSVGLVTVTHTVRGRYGSTSETFTVKVVEGAGSGSSGSNIGVVTANVYSIYTNEVPNPINTYYNPRYYGPSGNDSPYFTVQVDISQLGDYLDWEGNYWYISVESTDAAAALGINGLWNKILAAMSAEDQAKFRTWFPTGFTGYVLKREGSSVHIDGILDADPPAYVVELYDGGDSFKVLTKSGTTLGYHPEEGVTLAEARAAIDNYLGATVAWSSLTKGTYTKNGVNYDLTLTQTVGSGTDAATGVIGYSVISQNTYFVAAFDITITESEVQPDPEPEPEPNTYTVTYYVDGVQYGEVETYAEGAEVAALRTYTPAAGYSFSGWTITGGGETLSALPETMPAYNIEIRGTTSQSFGDDVNNYPSFTIKKVDSKDPSKSMQGVVFTLTNTETGESVDYTIGSGNTVVVSDLKAGTYTLVEKSTLPGYTVTDEVWTIVVTQSGEVAVELNEELNVFQKVYNWIISLFQDAGGSDALVNGVLTVENVYSAEGSITINGTKTFNKTIGKDQFWIVLKDSTGAEIERAAVGTDGSFSFKLDYTEADIGKSFNYTVSELNGGSTIGGVQYDADIISITVAVADNGDGTLNVTRSDSNEVAFQNVYSISEYAKVTISGYKYLDHGVLTDGLFEFLIQAADANGNPLTGENAYSETVSNVGGGFTFSTIEIKEAGTYYFLVTEVEGDLKNYSYDDASYIVKVVVTDNNDGTLDAVITSETIEFHNTYVANGTYFFEDGYKYLEGAELKAGQFSFNLLDEYGVVLTTVTNDADGVIDYDFYLHFDQSDIGNTYTYYFDEVNAGEEGYTYSTLIYKLSVTVVDNGNGELGFITDLTVGGFKTGSIEFVNYYEGGEIIVPEDPIPGGPNPGDEPGEDPGDEPEIEIPEEPVPGADSPETGDNTAAALLWTLLIASFGGILAVLLTGRKKKADAE